MMTKLDAQRDALPVRTYDLKVTRTYYGTVSVKAHSLKEAQFIATMKDDDEIDWSDWDTETEEDV